MTFAVGVLLFVLSCACQPAIWILGWKLGFGGLFFRSEPPPKNARRLLALRLFLTLASLGLMILSFKFMGLWPGASG